MCTFYAAVTAKCDNLHFDSHTDIVAKTVQVYKEVLHSTQNNYIILILI